MGFFGDLVRAVQDDVNLQREGPNWRQKRAAFELEARHKAAQIRGTLLDNERTEKTTALLEQQERDRSDVHARDRRDYALADAFKRGEMAPVESQHPGFAPNGEEMAGPILQPMEDALIPEAAGQEAFFVNPATLYARMDAKKRAAAIREMQDKADAEAAAEKAKWEAQGYGVNGTKTKAQIDQMEAEAQRANASRAGFIGHPKPVYGGPTGRDLLGFVAPNGAFTPAPVNPATGLPYQTTPDPNIAQGSRTEIAARDSVLGLIDDVDNRVKGIESTLGPVMGTLLKVQMKYLGGYGTTPQEQEAATALATLLSERSFAEGGKNLTGTEKEMLSSQLPAPTDTVEQALSKLRVVKQFLTGKQRNALEILSPDQYDHVQPRFWERVGLPAGNKRGGGGAGAPPPASSTTPSAAPGGKLTGTTPSGVGYTMTPKK